MAGNGYYKYIIDGMRDRTIQESVTRYGRFMDLYQDFSRKAAAADVQEHRKEGLLARNLWKKMWPDQPFPERPRNNPLPPTQAVSAPVQASGSGAPLQQGRNATPGNPAAGGPAPVQSRSVAPVTPRTPSGATEVPTDRTGALAPGNTRGGSRAPNNQGQSHTSSGRGEAASARGGTAARGGPARGGPARGGPARGGRGGTQSSRSARMTGDIRLEDPNVFSPQTTTAAATNTVTSSSTPTAQRANELVARVAARGWQPARRGGNAVDTKLADKVTKEKEKAISSGKAPASTVVRELELELRSNKIRIDTLLDAMEQGTAGQSWHHELWDLRRESADIQERLTAAQKVYDQAKEKMLGPLKERFAAMGLNPTDPPQPPPDNDGGWGSGERASSGNTGPTGNWS